MSQDAKSVLSIYQSYLREGKLAYQYCAQADKPVFYPREICPYTGDCELEWRVASGIGTVYSATTVNVKDGDAYNVSLIDCDEGFRLMSRVEDIAVDRVAIGMRVRFARTANDDGDPFPVFAPTETA